MQKQSYLLELDALLEELELLLDELLLDDEELLDEEDDDELHDGLGGLMYYILHIKYVTVVSGAHINQFRMAR